MAYPAFHYPPGYAQFTAQVFTHRSMMENGKVSATEATQYPVEEYVRQYGADTVKEWIASYCEMGTKHQDEILYTQVIASIQRFEHRFEHGARGDKTRLSAPFGPE